MKKSIITQSNYIPWKGYFDSIAMVDTFVVYDDMQYTKRDWRNRNLIKTPNGLKWISIPVDVSGKFNQKIKDTRIADKNWGLNHWLQLKQFYAKAPFFKEMSEWVEPLYKNCNYNFLTDVNLMFIQSIMKFLNINTEILYSSQFNLSIDRNERLINICKALGVTHYFSGPAAKNYMDENLFTDSNIKVHYFDYSGYPNYAQLNDPFEHGVTILDLIFNVGNKSRDFMKAFKS